MAITRSGHPLLYHSAVAWNRFKRWVVWCVRVGEYASTFAAQELAEKVFSHASLLLRELGGVDMRLQYNKITNLKLAAACVDRVLIRPGETFSLWRLVGNPTAARGYVPGMMLSEGSVVEGVGGGLCQLANLLYWIALHSPLTVTERHHHSFDVFPDSGRVLPFGSGATIFYNYLDLELYNGTDVVFELRVTVDDVHVRGELRADRESPSVYAVIERDHRFLFEPKTGKYFRANTLFREIRERVSGRVTGEELICRNYSEVKYTPHPGVPVEVVL